MMSSFPLKLLLSLTTIIAIIDGQTTNCIGSDECKDRTLSCTAGSECDVNCDGKTACGDARILGENAASLDLDCDGQDSCKAVYVDCPESGACTVTCNEKTSCGDITIDASNALSLRLSCGSNDACKGSTIIRCPTTTADGSSCTITCTTGTSCDEAEIIDPRPICTCTGIGCTSLENCNVAPAVADATTAPDTTSVLNTTGLDTTIQDTTIAPDVSTVLDVTTVPDALGAVNNCLLSGDCVCPATSVDCTLNCNRDQSCKDGVVRCLEANSNMCIVNCGDSSLDEDTCSGDTVIRADGSGDLTVNCGVSGSGSKAACKDATIRCNVAAGQGCTVNCDGTDACSGNARIEADTAGSLTVTCGIGDPVCKNIEISCPTGTTDVCIINCSTGNSCQDAEVVAGGTNCECHGSIIGCDNLAGCFGSNGALSDNGRIIGEESGDEESGGVSFNDNHDETGQDYGNEKRITLSFSDTTTINLWAVVVLFALLNVAMYICYNRMNSKSKGISSEKNYVADA